MQKSKKVSKKHARKTRKSEQKRERARRKRVECTTSSIVNLLKTRLLTWRFQYEVRAYQNEDLKEGEKRYLQIKRDEITSKSRVYHEQFKLKCEGNNTETQEKTQKTRVKYTNIIKKAHIFNLFYK